MGNPTNLNTVETLNNAANNATAAADEKFPTIFAFKVIGHLGHDNKLFDRTCADCRGMYSSRITQVCPKCNKQLVVTTTKSGKPMAISEGTIYPSFWNKRKAQDAQAIGNRKNGMMPMYRFKVFSFADDNGILAPPTDHHRMLSGAKVEILIINHNLIPSWYQTKNKEPMVELMIQVYPHFGDHVKVLAAPKSADASTMVPQDAAGNPVLPDVSHMQGEIDRLNAKIAAMEGTAPAPQSIPTTGTPVAQAAATAAAEMPFAAVDGGINPSEAADVTSNPSDDTVDPFAGV